MPPLRFFRVNLQTKLRRTSSFSQLSILLTLTNEGDNDSDMDGINDAEDDDDDNDGIPDYSK